jgi:murein DD-endopeptidase MepM/ murein hydrolase activator NlpD
LEQISVPWYNNQESDWKWNFPVTSEFGKRTAPTAGASTYHEGIDIGVGAGTPLTYKGYGLIDQIMALVL